MARLNLTQAMGIEDLRGKTRAELMDILAPIRDAANKRLNRLEQAGQTAAPAYQAAMESGGKIYGSKYNTIKDLQSEIRRGQAIIRYKTSTVEGAKKYYRDMTGRTPKQGRVKYKANLEGTPGYEDLVELEDDKQISNYWNILDKLNELGHTGLSTEMYNTMKALIRNSVKSDDAVHEVMNRLPASSHEYINQAIAEAGGLGDDEMDNVANVINYYLDWRTEHGYLGKTAKEKEEEEGPVFLL